MSTALTITLLGTGSPLPDADRAALPRSFRAEGRTFWSMPDAAC